MSDFNVSFDPPKDGGPAFPSHGSMGEVVSEGMSLRDYFAAKAMNASIGVLITREMMPYLQKNSSATGVTLEEYVAAAAYAMADAMLKARKS